LRGAARRGEHGRYMKSIGLAFVARPWVSALFVSWSIGAACWGFNDRLDRLTKEVAALRSPWEGGAEPKRIDPSNPDETIAQKRARLRALHRQVQDLYLKEVILEDEVEKGSKPFDVDDFLKGNP